MNHRESLWFLNLTCFLAAILSILFKFVIVEVTQILEEMDISNVTVLIPAHNRPDRLRRLLTYYAKTTIKVLVSDSSSTVFPDADEFREVIYRHFPNMLFLEKINRVLPLIETPYVVFCADDDFIVPEAIDKMTHFLNDNPDYMTAHGHYLTFTEERKGTLVFTPRYIRNFNFNIDAEKVHDRLVQYRTAYASMLYSVCRTSLFKQMYQDVISPNGAYAFQNLYLAEEYYNIYTTIHGKHAVLPVFYAARERIRGSAASITIPLAQLLSSAEKNDEYQGFLGVLSRRLSVQDGETEAEAKKYIHDFLYAKVSAPIGWKQKIINFVGRYSFLSFLTNFFDKRYATKGLKAVKGLGSYPCEFTTPEKEAIIRAIQSH